MEDFQRKVHAAAMAAWWVVLLAACLLILSWGASLVVLSAQPGWFLSMCGPEVTWAELQHLWFWAIVIFKIVVWFMVFAALWLTLWARQLREERT